jgi:hypothetical protein
MLLYTVAKWTSTKSDDHEVFLATAHVDRAKRLVQSSGEVMRVHCNTVPTCNSNLGDLKLIPGFRSPTDRNFENSEKKNNTMLEETDSKSCIYVHFCHKLGEILDFDRLWAKLPRFRAI